MRANTADILAEGHDPRVHQPWPIHGQGGHRRTGGDRCLRLLDEAAATLRSLAVTGLICIGGDGSLTIAEQLFEHGMPVVGVPKTIDNDLGATAFTFGFDSAVAAATALRSTACGPRRPATSGSWCSR